MGEKITGLTGMQNNIRFSDGTPICLEDLPGLKLLKILADEHGGRQTIDDVSCHANANEYSSSVKVKVCTDLRRFNGTFY
jgi:hypothetical protein